MNLEIKTFPNIYYINVMIYNYQITISNEKGRKHMKDFKKQLEEVKNTLPKTKEDAERNRILSTRLSSCSYVKVKKNLANEMYDLNVGISSKELEILKQEEKEILEVDFENVKKISDLTEVWKDIPGWEGIYQISTKGRVRSLDRYVELPNGALRRHNGRLRKATYVGKHSVTAYVRLVHRTDGIEKHDDINIIDTIGKVFIDPNQDKYYTIIGSISREDLYKEDEYGNYGYEKFFNILNIIKEQKPKYAISIKGEDTIFSSILDMGDFFFNNIKNKEIKRPSSMEEFFINNAKKIYVGKDCEGYEYIANMDYQISEDMVIKFYYGRNRENLYKRMLSNKVCKTGKILDDEYLGIRFRPSDIKFGLKCIINNGIEDKEKISSAKKMRYKYFTNNPYALNDSSEYIIQKLDSGDKKYYYLVNISRQESNAKQNKEYKKSSSDSPIKIEVIQKDMISNTDKNTHEEGDKNMPTAKLDRIKYYYFLDWKSTSYVKDIIFDKELGSLTVTSTTKDFKEAMIFTQEEFDNIRNACKKSGSDNFNKLRVQYMNVLEIQ